MSEAARQQFLSQMSPRNQRLPYTREALKQCVDHLGFEIGVYTYGVPVVRWWGEPAVLRIGKFCSIADRVELFLGGNHRTDWATTYPFTHSVEWPEGQTLTGHPATRGNIVIGNDVWLASGCSIVSGVTIGDGAVIGAHSVVSRDVAPYAIVSGNPSEVRRMRFDSNDIARLQEMCWWEWPEAAIHEAVPLLCAADIGALYAFWKERVVNNARAGHV